MREKLIELLEHDDCPIFMVFGDNMKGLADYLIANGVTIPVRCKDCKYYRPPFCLINDNKHGWLNHELPEHFCSHGERQSDG